MRFDYLQVLRFFAAAAVIFFHVLGAVKTYFHVPDAGVFEVFRFGYCGVDIFFVISGFIMYYITQTGEGTPRIFLLRRVQRIVPLYWLATAALFALMLALPAVVHSTFGIGDLLRSLSFTAFAAGRTPVIFVGWSLEFEMYFYLAVTAALFFGRRAWPIVITGFSAIVALGCLIPNPGPVVTFFTEPLIFEFILGALCGAVFFGAGPRLLWLAAGAAAIAIAMRHGVSRVFVFGLPGAALVYGSAWLSRAWPQDHPVKRVFVALGDASYSIYLVQVLANIAAVRLLLRLWKTAPAGLAIVLCAFASIIAGYLVWRWVERPMQKALRTFAGRAVATP